MTARVVVRCTRVTVSGTAAAPSGSARRGVGDALWRLATEQHVEALTDAAARLAFPDGDADYDARRARAFALAVEGTVDGALDELTEGWTEDWPTPPMFAADVARVHLLAGDASCALDALDLAVRSTDRPYPGTLELAERCVERERGLWRKALAVVRRAPAADRAAGTVRIVRAATRRS